MSFQYVYTSAPRGLEPGKSGFCCVARSPNMLPDLIQELERTSRFGPFPHGAPSPRIQQHRIVELRSGAYHILTTLQDAGTDYTKRNNHLAHHLVFTPEELLSLPDPATLLLNWKGWLERWDEPPRILGDKETFSLEQLSTPRPSPAHPELPQLVANKRPLPAVIRLSEASERQAVRHFRASLAQLPASERWQIPFTNFIQATDRPNDYTWIATRENHPLPFDLSACGKTTPSSPETNSLHPSAETPQTPPPEPSRSREAPANESSPQPERPPRITVEVPAAYDRSKRKRLKTKLKDREISRLVNLSLVLVATLAAWTFYHWYNSEEPLSQAAAENRPQATLSRDAPDLSAPTPSKPSPETPSPLLRWQRFAADGYPPSELASLSEILPSLPAPHQAEAIATLDFLKALAEPPPRDTPISVPAKLLLAPSEERTELRLSPERYPILQRSLLSPRDFAQSLENLNAALPFPPHIAHNLRSPSWSPNHAIEQLQAYQGHLRSLLLPSQSKARQDLASFEAELATLQSTADYAAILAIHQAFELPDSAAFLPVSPEGLLSDPNSQSHSDYLATLFLEYTLAHYDKLQTGQSFREAFNHIAEQVKRSEGSPAPSSQLETAKSIYRAIQLAEATPDFAPRWLAIRNAWQAAFIRRDLMQEALVSFNLEAIDDAKAKLRRLQSQFTPEQHAAYLRYRECERRIQEAQKQALSATLDEEWVVIPSQNANF